MKKLLKHKVLCVFLGLLLSIVLFFVVINVIPPVKSIDENPFIIEKGSKPLIAAHRGGKNLNPENTFKAIDYAIENCHIDILEMDVCLTKDRHLVLAHNLTLDAYANVPSSDYKISSHTLEELEQLNMGYNFQKNGEYLYRDLLNDVDPAEYRNVLVENGLKIVTIPELFAKYANTDLKYIIEIKNSGVSGKLAAKRLTDAAKEYGIVDKIVIGTFHDEIETELKEKYSEFMRGASLSVARGFVVTQLFKVNIFDDSDFHALQIPTDYELKGIEIDLTMKTIIRRAHRRNISVQYWTINDKEEMRMLIEKGADVIMTDAPDVMYELLVEMGYYD